MPSETGLANGWRSMQRQRTSRSPRTVVLLKCWGYRACWCSLLALHAMMAVFYARFAIFYGSLHQTNLAFQLRTYSIGIAQSEYDRVAAAHVVVAAIHAVYLALMTLGSLTARRLVFYPTTSVDAVIRGLYKLCNREVQPLNQVDRTSTRATAESTVLHRLLGLVNRGFLFVFGRTGLLGVDGLYFDDLLVLRELFETALQTYQAYRMTQLLPRLGLIRVYVLLLVINCWSVPVLHRVYGDHHRKRRIFNLIFDSVLDAVSSMGITVLLFSSYSPQYTDPRFGFPFANWFNDLWFTSVYQEFQMILVVSWVDMLSRLVFVVGLLQNMDAIKDLLQPVTLKPFNVVVTTKVAPFNREPTRLTILEARATLPYISNNRFQRATKYLLHTVGPRLFIVWGLAILGIHGYAEYQAESWPCRLRLRPWLTSKPACSLVEINCQSFDDATSVDDPAWMMFDPKFTAHLTIRHCSALTMPSSLQQYNALASFKIYNSTIASWPETAAITSKDHASLCALYFVRTTFINATLPPGLMTTQFPQRLRSIIVSSSNLETLPADLYRVWPQRMSLTFEYSRFTSIPDVIMKLKPALVSFSQNPITSVPASLFQIPTLANLLLCYTLIQELPRDVANPSGKLYVLMVEGTNISTLWSWMDPIIARSLTFRNKRFFNLHGTQFCKERDQIQAGTRTSFSASGTVPKSALASVMDVVTPETLTYSNAAVACELDMISFFPLALEDAVSATA